MKNKLYKCFYQVFLFTVKDVTTAWDIISIRIFNKSASQNRNENPFYSKVFQLAFEVFWVIVISFNLIVTEKAFYSVLIMDL